MLDLTSKSSGLDLSHSISNLRNEDKKSWSMQQAFLFNLLQTIKEGAASIIFPWRRNKTNVPSQSGFLKCDWIWVVFCLLCIYSFKQRGVFFLMKLTLLAKINGNGWCYINFHFEWLFPIKWLFLINLNVRKTLCHVNYGFLNARITADYWWFMNASVVQAFRNTFNNCWNDTNHIVSSWWLLRPSPGIPIQRRFRGYVALTFQQCNQCFLYCFSKVDSPFYQSL